MRARLKRVWLSSDAVGEVRAAAGVKVSSARKHKPVTRLISLLSDIWESEQGAVAIQMALISVVLLGMTSLATDVGYAYYMHRQMQSAADTAVFSAAQAIVAGFPASYSTEAYAVAGKVGFVNGANGVVVTVNKPPASPPASGTYAANSPAVQVIVQQPQTLPLIGAVCSILGGCTGALTVAAQAVAGPVVSGGGCMLQLGSSANPGVNLTGGGNITLDGCGMALNSTAAGALTMTGGTQINLNNSAGVADAKQTASIVGGASYHNGATVNGVAAPAPFSDVKTNQAATADPYASVPLPSKPATQCATSNGTTLTSSTSKGVTTVKYGSNYNTPITSCYWPAGDIVQLTNNANLSLGAGVYYLSGGSLSVGGNVTLTGNNVTLVLTGSGSNWASISITNGAKVTLTAPSSGADAGIAIYGDRNAPTTISSSFVGGSTMNITGAIYLPTQQVTFANGAGNPTGCLQLIAGSIAVSGGVTLSNNCNGYGTNPIVSGSTSYQLVE